MESNVVFQAAPSIGVNFHRIVMPGNWVSYLSNRRVPLMEGPLNDDVLGGVSHVVFNSRLTEVPGKQEEEFKRYRKAGVRLILDLDDYWLIKGSYSRYKHQDREQYQKDVMYCIKNADMVWCASLKLADEVKELNSNSHYVPNTLSIQDLAKGSVKNIGVFGTVADHKQDLELVTPTIANINEVPGTEYVFWTGADNLEDTAFISDALQSSNKPYGIMRISNPNDYLQQFHRCTLVLAPMVERPFNAYHSCLRAIEAGAYGCTFVGSDTAPFAEIIENDVNGILIKNKKDWTKQLAYLARNPGFCKDLSSKLQEDVSTKFDPKKWNQVRLDLINTLV